MHPDQRSFFVKCKYSHRPDAGASEFPYDLQTLEYTAFNDQESWWPRKRDIDNYLNILIIQCVFEITFPIDFQNDYFEQPYLQGK